MSIPISQFSPPLSLSALIAISLFSTAIILFLFYKLFYKSFVPFFKDSTYVVVQLLSCVWLFATLWTAAYQAPLSSIISRSVLQFMSIESVMLSNHLILAAPFSFWLQSFPASGSFSMSWFFADPTCKQYHIIFVFLCLIYFTQYDNLWVLPHHCKWCYFVFFFKWLSNILLCVCTAFLSIHPLMDT